MKRIAFVLVMISVMGVAMGQQVINGVYQGSPSSFMYLPTTPPAPIILPPCAPFARAIEYHSSICGLLIPPERFFLYSQ